MATVHIGESPRKLIWKELFPLFTISRCLGIFPYDNRFKSSKILVLYSYIVTTFFMSLSLILKLWYMFSVNDPWFVTSDRIFLGIIQIFGEVGTVCVHLLCDRKWKLVSKDFHEIGLVKTKFSQMFATWLTIFTLIYVFGCCMVYSFFTEWANIYGFFLIFSNLFHSLFFYIIILQFCSSIEIVNCMLKDVNKQLNLFRTPDEVLNFINLYYLLQNKFIKINNRYSLSTLTAISRIVVQLVLCIYLSINLLNVASQENLTQAIMIWINSVFEVFLLYCLTGICMKTYRQDEHFKNKILFLMLRDENLLKNENLQIFLRRKTQLILTAHGFFTLGYPFITSITGAVVMYVIILMQTDQLKLEEVDVLN
uniref:Gustatory receptor n=1 Tax=Rhodnius prolixus TaxID=13249 RepID=T1H9Q9_RHOPR